MQWLEQLLMLITSPPVEPRPACSLPPLPKCEAHVDVCYILDGALTPNNALAFPASKALLISAITSLGHSGDHITVLESTDTGLPRIIVPTTTKGEANDYAAKISAATQAGTKRNLMTAIAICEVRLSPDCYALCLRPPYLHCYAFLPAAHHDPASQLMQFSKTFFRSQLFWTIAMATLYAWSSLPPATLMMRRTQICLKL